MDSKLGNLISTLAYSLTILLNSSLIYLTAYYTKRISRTYRQMIIGFAMIGMLFSTCDMLVRPIMHSYNEAFIYFSVDGVFRKSKGVTEVLLVIYSAIYSIILSFLTIQYVFRTCLLIRPDLTVHFRGFKFLLWLGYVALFGVAWGYTTYVQAYPDDYAKEYVREELFKEYRVNVYEIPFFVMLAYQETENGKKVRLQSLICIFGDMGIITIQYMIMITCGVLMYQKIRRDLQTVTSNSLNSKVQKQFFKALVYQLAAPSLLVHLPAVPLFFAPFFDFKISFRTRIVVYFFSFYPLFDSLILFWIVSDYGIAVKQIITMWARLALTLLQKQPTTNTTSSTPGFAEDVL